MLIPRSTYRAPDRETLPLQRRDIGGPVKKLHSVMCTPYGNHLLAMLPADSRERLFPHLEPVHLELGTVLYEPNQVLHFVYFPTDAIVSLMHVMENGASSEIAVVGNDGVVGLSMLLGGRGTSGSAVVQSAGGAYRLSGQRIRNEFERNGALLKLLLHYAQSLISQLAQTVICSRHHTVDQQLCRWILMSLDRLPDNHLTMTHERIANLLGVRREGVSEAAGKLQRFGVINYTRGKITVLDRDRLEQLSCECYQAVRREAARLLPHPVDMT